MFKRGMFKRIVAVFLAIIMFTGVLPITAFAEIRGEIEAAGGPSARFGGYLGEILAILDEGGIRDAEGNTLFDSVVFNGRIWPLSEITPLLWESGTDLSALAIIGGHEISHDEILLMAEIEAEIEADYANPPVLVFYRGEMLFLADIAAQTLSEPAFIGGLPLSLGELRDIVELELERIRLEHNFPVPGGNDGIQEVLDFLRRVGLRDAQGNPITSLIYFNGTYYTLEQIVPILYDPGTDLGAVIFVDGIPLTLGDLLTMIEIEMELAEIERDFFGGPEFEITPEHMLSWQSLLAQLQSEGIPTAEAGAFNALNDGRPNWVNPQHDFNDERVVTATIDGMTHLGWPTLTFTKSENLAGQEVSFMLEIIHGSSHDWDFVPDWLAPRPIVIPANVNFVTINMIDLFVQQVRDGTRGAMRQRGFSFRGDALHSTDGNFSTTFGNATPDLMHQAYGFDPMFEMPGVFDLRREQLHLARILAWRGYGRTFYMHAYTFQNFDRMEIIGMDRESMRTAEHNVNIAHGHFPRIMPFMSHTWAGGAYMGFDIFAHATDNIDDIEMILAVHNRYIEVVDAYSRLPEKLTFNTRAPNAPEQRLYTGQLVPVRFGFSTDIVAAGHEVGFSFQPAARPPWQSTNLTGGHALAPNFTNIPLFGHIGTSVITSRMAFEYIVEPEPSSNFGNYNPLSNVFLATPGEPNTWPNVAAGNSFGFAGLEFAQRAMTRIPAGSTAMGSGSLVTRMAMSYFTFPPLEFQFRINAVVSAYFNAGNQREPFNEFYALHNNAMMPRTDDLNRLFNDMRIDNVHLARDRSEISQFITLTIDNDTTQDGIHSFTEGDTINVRLSMDRSSPSAIAATDSLLHRPTQAEWLFNDNALRVGFGICLGQFIPVSNFEPCPETASGAFPDFIGSIEITPEMMDMFELTGATPMRLMVQYNSDRWNPIPAPGAGNPQTFQRFNDLFAYFQLNPVILIEEAHVQLTSEWPSGRDYVAFLIDESVSRFGFTLDPSYEFTFPGHYEWSSSNDDIATIIANDPMGDGISGVISPVSGGRVHFYLTFFNNDRGYPVVIQTPEVYIDTDQPPNVIIPAALRRITAEFGRNAVVRWHSNLMHIARQSAPTPDEAAPQYFHVELYSGYHELAELADLQPIASWSAPDDARLINAQAFDIPAGVIATISQNGIPSFTVRVWALNPDTGATLQTFAHIYVRMPAAVVRMELPETVHFSDSIDSIPFRWTLDNFDTFNDGFEFEFSATRNGQRISHIHFHDPNNVPSGLTPARTHGFDGFIHVPIEPVSGPRFRDVYTVEMRAKNAADSTWSFESLVFWVYAAGSLAITVDGVRHDNVLLSNRDLASNWTDVGGGGRFSHDTNRQIDLNRPIGVNWRDFAASDAPMTISDRIEWAGNEGAAALWFDMFGNVMPLEQVNIETFLPNETMVLFGQRTGEGRITATHARTGHDFSLDVTVERLDNMLYLFQFLPRQTTMISFTNGAGQTRNLTTNDQGAIAVFEEHGIAGHVHATARSELGYLTHTGVFSPYHLLSGESAPNIGVYPLNTFRLRETARIDVFLKHQDGQPFSGSVTVNAGVYRNGHYMELAEVRGEQVNVGADGRVTLRWDTRDFWSAAAGQVASDAYELTAHDRIDFMVEVLASGFNPILVIADGNTGVESEIRTGRRIQYLSQTNGSDVVMAAQNVFLGDSDQPIPMLNNRGFYGPSVAHPEITIETTFIWRSRPTFANYAQARLECQSGFTPSLQISETVNFPFSDFYYTIHRQILNERSMWFEQAARRSLTWFVEDGRPTMDGGTGFRRSFRQAATLINMIGIQPVTRDEIQAISDQAAEDATSAEMNFEGMGGGNAIIAMVLTGLADTGIETEPLTIALRATEDPLVFRMLLSVSMGNTPESIVNPEGGADFDFMVSDTQFSFIPGPMDLNNMREGSYARKEGAKFNEARAAARRGDNHRDRRLMFTMSGFSEVEIRFNPATQRWESLVLAGGFNAGGGVEIQWRKNMLVGPVPVVAEIAVGGVLEFGFQQSALFAPTWYGRNNHDRDLTAWSDPDTRAVNDVLLRLRVHLYIRAFAGVGFDFAIVAARIGIFGQITFEYNLLALLRRYAEDVAQQDMVGHALALRGELGLEVQFRLLFIRFRYSLTLVSTTYTWTLREWDNIVEYWTRTTGRGLVAGTSSPLEIEQATMAYMAHLGVSPFMLEPDGDVRITLEDRDYLHRHPRSWNTGSPFMPLAIDPENRAPAELQSNAYPYAEPQLSDDANFFVFLHDADSPNIEDTVISWASRNGDGFAYRGPIVRDNTMYGDSSISLAGNTGLAAAAWVRQHISIDRDPGDEMSAEDFALMAGGAEIMVAIKQNGTWNDTAIRLTDNATPDLAPQVAVAGDKVFIVWRNSLPGSAQDAFSFVGDQLLFKVFDINDPWELDSWSEPHVLYNGTAGDVRGLTAQAIELDGAVYAAVAYSLLTDTEFEVTTETDPGQSPETDIIFAVIALNGAGGARAFNHSALMMSALNDNNEPSVIRSLRVAAGGSNDDPQLTTAVFADDVERFILGYFTSNEHTTGNIELHAFDAIGDLHHGFVDDLTEMLFANDAQVRPGFRFARSQNGYLSELALLWTEARFEEEMLEIGGTEHTATTVRDVLRGVRFIEEDNGLFWETYVSGAVDIAVMPDFTTIDNFDAYTESGGGTVRAIILGTEFRVDSSLNRYEISAMYTATAMFTHNIELTDLFFNPSDIIAEADLPIVLTVLNQGYERIRRLEFNLGGQITGLDVNIRPNETGGFTLSYQLPAGTQDDRITDIDLTITAHFVGGGEVVFDVITLWLDVVDIGLGDPIILSEQDGVREMLLPVFNLSDAKLEGSGARVIIELFDNNVFEDESLIDRVLVISNDTDFALIDEGGFVALVEFDILEYITALELYEIPDSGVRIWIRARVEREVEDEWTTVSDFFIQNDSVSVLFENLSTRNNNERTNVTFEMENDLEQGRTSITFALQNLLMEPVENGNLLLNLFDDEGEIIETIIAREQHQLIAMGEEAIVEATYTFAGMGSSVSAVFFTDEPGAPPSVHLTNATIAGVLLYFDPEIVNYSLTASKVWETTLQFVARASAATVTVTLNGYAVDDVADLGSNVFVAPVVLQNGVNTVVVTVSHPGQGVDDRRYTFTINN
ncbi:MAG: hypothetical protein LBE35_02420, partial [Clostridiales bacterium]|nr:hypothetical protein [Clostridiales bacterium]